ncbi:polysaccharide deacetylase family protein [Octadecabacter sp. 1_MG-2023]|uniref:polysaccharide deacetylase family protein n=1 Tax=unclassified Octadecabacter TaxID=196158 RepID=UPI001C09C5D7|nr:MULTISPECIES: polysaccharide deacetylase family protein [unclassified Octadecabacter]MBU2993515.1 polysaccharide deacetylase family protein [Octadecabacter sp. B2R22]MDO6735642.1 polysaccharide deacetylase family protein [Octadecabacter sp. 1_MG-2023]
MVNLSRRHALAAGLGFGAATLAGSRASARPLIRLPDDLVLSDAATITAVRTPSPVVAMTFDDGPHPTHTPRLLDMLRERGLRATFYLIGNRVVQYPQIARRIAEEGHEIGNHSWSHPFLNNYSDRSAILEIDQTTNAIFQVTGRPPVTFRPPYGAFTRRQRTLLHDTRSLPTILWSVDPQDWRRPGSNVVANRILSHTQQGGIILSHDIHRGTVDAMPQTLDGLTARGLHFVTVSQILGWPLWQSRNFRMVTESG